MIVDDHPAIQHALATAIEAEEDMHVVAAVSSAGEALRIARESPPDVAIVDISLRDSYGLKLIEDLSDEVPDVDVVVYSMYDENIYAKRSISAGASGYVMKQEPTSKVLAAIRSVLEGNVYVSSDLASSLIESMARTGSTEATSPFENLSNQEFAVFHLLGQGYTVEDIGDQLDRSRRTIQATLRRIKEKLGLESTRAVIEMATHWFHHRSTNKGPSQSSRSSYADH